MLYFSCCTNFVLYACCIKVCVCVLFLCSTGCVVLTKLCRWWGSNTGQGILQPYTLCAPLIYAWREVRCPHLLHNERFLNGQNTLIIDYNLVAWESATVCLTNTYFFPFWKYLSINVFYACCIFVLYFCVVRNCPCLYCVHVVCCLLKKQKTEKQKTMCCTFLCV